MSLIFVYFVEWTDRRLNKEYGEYLLSEKLRFWQQDVWCATMGFFIRGLARARVVQVPVTCTWILFLVATGSHIALSPRQFLRRTWRTSLPGWVVPLSSCTFLSERLQKKTEGPERNWERQSADIILEILTSRTHYFWLHCLLNHNQIDAGSRFNVSYLNSAGADDFD